MIKFIHKRHMHESKKDSKIIIYYNASDIFLGTALLILVVFFINNYLSHELNYSDENAGFQTNQTY